VKVFILRRILFWTTLAWWESNEELPKSKFKKFLRTSLAVLKKVAMILPLSRLKFFVCCNQKISASAVAKV
jgi:hypothetical protein